MSEFKKYDSQKQTPLAALVGLRKHGVTPAMLLEAVKVLDFGALKYDARNWQLCTEPNRYLEAIARHAMELMSGMDIDPETGEHHGAHILCNALLYLGVRLPDLTE